MQRKRPTLLLATLAVCACGDRAHPPVTELTIDTLADGSILVANPPHGLWDANPGTRWRLVESLRIGTASEGGPDAFGNVISLTLDELGRLWIVDSQANEVGVFDGDGRFVRTIGGRGEGPAEFIGIGSVRRGPNGEMWVADDDLGRFEIFDTAATRIGGQRYVTRFGGGWRRGLFLAYDWIEDPDRRVYRVYRRGATGRLEPDGRVFELPEEPPDPPMIDYRQGGATLSSPAPFSPQHWWTFGPNLDIWWSDGYGLGGRYELRQIDLESGRTLRTVLRQYEPVAISAGDSAVTVRGAASATPRSTPARRARPMERDVPDPQSAPSEPRYGERDDPASQASHCGSPLPAPCGTFRKRETGAECSVSQTRVMSSAMPGPGAPVVMATTSTAAATGLPSSPSIALRHRSRAYSITAQRGSRSSSAASAATSSSHSRRAWPPAISSLTRSM